MKDFTKITILNRETKAIAMPDKGADLPFACFRGENIRFGYDHNGDLAFEIPDGEIAGNWKRVENNWLACKVLSEVCGIPERVSVERTAKVSESFEGL